MARAPGRPARGRRQRTTRGAASPGPRPARAYVHDVLARVDEGGGAVLDWHRLHSQGLPPLSTIVRRAGWRAVTTAALAQAQAGALDGAPGRGAVGVGAARPAV